MSKPDKRMFTPSAVGSLQNFKTMAKHRRLAGILPWLHHATQAIHPSGPSGIDSANPPTSQDVRSRHTPPEVDYPSRTAFEICQAHTIQGSWLSAWYLENDMACMRSGARPCSGGVEADR